MPEPEVDPLEAPLSIRSNPPSALATETVSRGGAASASSRGKGAVPEPEAPFSLGGAALKSSRGKAARPVPEPEAPFSTSSILVCCLVNLNEAVSGNIIFPLLPSLVARYVANPVEIGFYVGLLGSSYFLGQVLTVRTFGTVSDMYGRRPVLLFGLLGSLLSFVWFGLARTYIEAVLSRFLCGCINGNVAINKIYVGEVTTKSSQATGFAWLSLTWGLGTLVAPALGGFLADPAALYPGSALDTPLLRAYPFLLPSLISVGFSAFCLALAIPLLKETEPWLKRNSRGGSSSSSSSSGGSSGGGSASTPSAAAAETAEEGGEGSEEEDALNEEEEEVVRLLSDRAEQQEGEEEEEEEGEGSDDNDDDEGAGIEGTPSKNKTGVATTASAAPAPEIMRTTSSLAIITHPVLGPAIAAYAALSALQIMFDELLPVFCSTAVEAGGLGWQSSTIGSVFPVAGLVQILSTLFLAPVLQRRLGAKASFQCFLYPLVPYFLAFPLVSRLVPAPPPSLYVAVCALVGLRTLLFSLPFSSVLLIINNLSPPAHLGLCVSVAQAVASAIRTVGPTLGGGIFSASMAATSLGVWRLQGPYILMAATTTLTLWLSTRISAHCNAPPE